MNIDTALRRREALEETSGDELLDLCYELLDEVTRLRAALTVPPDPKPWLSPLMPDDERYRYEPHAYVLDMPNVQLVVGKGDVRKLAEWFWMVGCDIGSDLFEEMGEEP